MKKIAKEEPTETCDKTCGMETIAVVRLTALIRDLVLIKKYAIERDDERIYLCADNIERKLQQLRYRNALLERDW